jgi:P-aminobenzoate N-oxygenase AurF
MTETQSMTNQRSFARTVDRLVQLSVDGYYNPYRTFQWPDHLDEDTCWMSPELLSVHGTEFVEDLSTTQLNALSKWESINFYSLNVHGIRELLHAVIARIHCSGYEAASKFFHHFVGEENEHMWFFAHFCLKYAGKIYPDRQVKIESAEDGPEDGKVENFLVFARITIFEEIVDFYNSRMGTDERLLPVIRQVNHLHHVDESRHIAFGRKLLALLHEDLKQTHDAETLAGIERYLRRYMEASMRGFYSPDVYRDAGVPDPLKFRSRVLAHPARASFHRDVLQRTTDFLERTGIIRPQAEIVQ